MTADGQVALSSEWGYAGQPARAMHSGNALKRTYQVPTGVSALQGRELPTGMSASPSTISDLRTFLEQIFQFPIVSALAACATDTDPKAARQFEEPFSLVSPQDCDKLPAGLEDAYPLARLQPGIFLHNEFDPESAVYHDGFSFRLHAPFEFEKLRLAANRLIERHAILRTSFHFAEFSEPLRLVHRHAEASFTSEDLRGATEPQQEEEIQRWIATERRMPFELGVPPLVRFHVLRLTDESFQFFISFHRACLDRWSLAPVLTELFKEYLGL